MNVTSTSLMVRSKPMRPTRSKPRAEHPDLSLGFHVPNVIILYLLGNTSMIGWGRWVISRFTWPGRWLRRWGSW